MNPLHCSCAGIFFSILSFSHLGPDLAIPIPEFSYSYLLFSAIMTAFTRWDFYPFFYYDD